MNDIDALIETIRGAVADAASPETKKLGADACRSLLKVLDTERGKPLADPPAPSSPLATAAAQLQNVPPDLILEGIIAKLRQHLPAAPTPTQPRPPGVRIPYVVVPTGPKGNKNES